MKSRAAERSGSILKYGLCVLAGMLAGLLTLVFVSPALVASLTLVEETPSYRVDAQLELELNRRELLKQVDMVGVVNRHSGLRVSRQLSAEIRTAAAKEREMVQNLVQAERKQDVETAQEAAGWRTDAAIALLLAGFGLTLSAVGSSAVADRSRKSIEQASIILGSFSLTMACASFSYLFGSKMAVGATFAVIVGFGSWLLAISKAGPGRRRIQGTISISVLTLALIVLLIGIPQDWHPRILYTAGAIALTAALLASSYRAGHHKGGTGKSQSANVDQRQTVCEGEVR